MRRRKNVVLLYLDDDELKSLDEWCEAARMNRNLYLRTLLSGFQPIAFPPLEYTQVMDELRKIGVNMNQLAVKAHSLGFIDEPEYRRNAQAVWRVCADMTEQLTKRGVKFGSHENMGCQEPSD